MSWFRLRTLIEPQMVRIEPGRFRMGSPENEEGRSDSEGPQHDVVIGYSFEVGRYPVTFREWDSAARLGACGAYLPNDEGWGRGRHPVINVSWNDAHSYIEFLNARTGKSYRLLSEAEWEYCCRAGTTTSYAFGASLTNRTQGVAFWNGEAFWGGRRIPPGYYWDGPPPPTAPVDKLWVNGWGLVGMHGNVWEWCEDVRHDDYSGADRPDDGRPWVIGPSNYHRIVRGGSCATSPSKMRSATRAWDAASLRFPVTGFRLARSL